MREKLETLPLAQLKELAKAQGIKGVSAMKKAELIDALCNAAEAAAAEKTKTEERKEEDEADWFCGGSSKGLPRSSETRLMTFF